MFFKKGISVDELEELRRSQVVYIEWCTARMAEKAGDYEWVCIYAEKIRMASHMTTRIDIELEARGAYTSI